MLLFGLFSKSLHPAEKVKSLRDPAAGMYKDYSKG